MKIVTHDGTFHTDELVAIALLRKFVLSKNVEIIRTRDEEKIQKYLLDKNVYVVDVGRKFEENLKNFDHHQRSFNEKWEDGIVLSSCGLVWRYIKRRGYLKKYDRRSIKNIEERIIKKIDLHDNGFGRWTFAHIFSAFNRENSSMEDFNKALEMASYYIENILYQEKLNEKNEIIFNNDFDKYQDEEIFFSQISIKNGYLLKKLANETKALVFIYKSNEHDDEERWYIKSIKRDFEEQDEPIGALAPENLRGLSYKVLTEQTGIKGAVFVHRSGHMAVFKSKKSAVKFANIMIENYHQNFGHLD